MINLPGYEGGLDDLADNTTLPILQDTSDDKVAEAYGGASDYTYIIDSAGYPLLLHYGLQFSTAEDRFLAEVTDAIGGGR